MKSNDLPAAASDGETEQSVRGSRLYQAPRLTLADWPNSTNIIKHPNIEFTTTYSPYHSS